MKKLVSLVALMLIACLSMTAFAVTGENVYPITDEPVTLTIWTPNQANRDYINCDMTKYLQEKTGVTIKFDLYTTSDENTTYNLMVANDQWPDIFLGPWFNPTRINIAVEGGMLLPLNDLIDEYGYNYRQVLEENPGYRKMLTAPDGNIYTFMYTDSGVHKACEYKMFIKQDWLDVLEMSMPTTLDEFKDYLIAVRDNDVNGNGDPDDEIPMVGFANGRKSDPICFFMNAFELYTDSYFTISDDGEIVFHANTDGWREGLKFLNELYEEGLIATETYVQDKTQFQALLNRPAAECIVGSFPFWYQGDAIDVSVLNWTDYEPVPPVAGYDGTRQAAARFGGNFNMVGAISSTCEYPEVAFRFLDYFIGEEGTYFGHYGKENVNWEWVDMPSFSGEDHSVRRITTDLETLWNSGSFPRADRASVRYATSMDETLIANKDNTYVLVHADDVYAPYYVNHNIPDIVWCNDEEVNATRNTLATTINDYIKTCDTQFVMGELDIDDDAAWEAYIDGLNQRGLDKYIETLTAYYGLN